MHSHSYGESITVNFGQSPFTFNIEGWLAEEKAQEEAAVQRHAPFPKDPP